MPRQRKTNVEFITDLMIFSSSGAMMQMFIIDALTKQADMVAKTTPGDYAPSRFDTESWISTAKELKEKLDAQYSSDTSTNPES